MFYHETIIQLHRPFLISDLADGGGGSAVEARYRSVYACFGSAQDICRILLIFNHAFTFQYLHPSTIPRILLAAMIHLLCSGLFKDRRAQTAQQHLRLCFHALTELSQRFSSALQALDIIKTLKKGLASPPRGRCTPPSS